MRTMIAVGGGSVFVLLIISALIGMKVIKASVKTHKLLSWICFIMILPHAAIGWIKVGTEPGVIMGTVMIALILLNILSGSGKVNLPVKAHMAIGILIGLIALLHGGVNLFNFIRSL